MTDTKIIVGLGSCGIAAGAQSVHEYLLEASKDTDIEVGITSCVGVCFAEPIVEVAQGGNFVRYGYVDVDFAERIIEGIKSDTLPEENRIMFDSGVKAYLSRQVKIALQNCGRIDPESTEDYLTADGYKAIEKAIKELTPRK